MTLFTSGRNYLVCVLVVMALLIFLQYSSYHITKHNFINIDIKSNIEIGKIAIGAVSCSKNVTNYDMINNIAVMIKSVFISAKLHGVYEVDAHIFLEHAKHMNILMGKFKGYEGAKPKLNFYFYSAVELVPVEHRDNMIYDRRYRCGYTRLFFPSALSQVDSLIYLDADMIITGNILKYWQVLLSMDSSQLVGVARNYEPENTNYDYLLDVLFRDIPFVPPRGLNSGLLVMNLTKMRGYSWEEKLLRVYNEYTNTTTLNDQRLLNIFLFYNPELLYQLDCVYNFLHGDCDKGFVCQGAQTDEMGVHGVHGTSDTFKVGGTFRSIWSQFEQYDVLSGDVYNDLIYEIKQSFRENGSETMSQCFGTLDKYLWKSI